MRRGAQRRRSSPALEIGGAHLAVGEELAPGAGERDLPGLHDIAAMVEPQGMVRVLLDQEHRDLLLLVAGERAAALALAPLEDGKEREDAAQNPGEMRRLRHGRAALQILEQ